MCNEAALRKWNDRFTHYLERNRLLFLLGSEGLQKIGNGAVIIGAKKTCPLQSTLFFRTNDFHWNIDTDKLTRFTSIRGNSAPGLNDIPICSWFNRPAEAEKYNTGLITKEDLQMIQTLFEQASLMRLIHEVIDEIQ